MLVRRPRPALRNALVRSTGKPPAAVVDAAGARALAPALAALVLCSPEAMVR